MLADDSALLAAGAASPFIGSFLGTLVLRLPESQPVLFARSCCSSCGHTLSPAELIPLASWVAQRGRCRHCGVRLSAFYPAIEVGAAIVVLWAATATQGVPFDFTCLLGWLLLALSLMDIRTYRLHDGLVVVLAIAGIFATMNLAHDRLLDHFFAGAAGACLLAGLAVLYRAARGRDGLGFGDVKLFGAAGLWVGGQGMISMLLIASFVALAGAFLLRLSGRSVTAQSSLPFGPFLAFGLWLVWLYGPIELSMGH